MINSGAIFIRRVSIRSRQYADCARRTVKLAHNFYSTAGNVIKGEGEILEPSNWEKLSGVASQTNFKLMKSTGVN